MKKEEKEEEEAFGSNVTCGFFKNYESKLL